MNANRVLDVPRASWRDDEDIVMFDDLVKKFFEKECEPFVDEWSKAGIVPREIWLKAGELGLLGTCVPEEYGGLGGDFRYDAVLTERVTWHKLDGWGLGLHNAITIPYILEYGTEEQKKRLLPKCITGEYITAIAMTEPGTGSDLQSIKTTAIKDGNEYVLNGSKTFISNGQSADLILVCAKTDPNLGGKGISIMLVEAPQVEGEGGFKRGRNLDKVGIHIADTSELFFDNVRIPADSVLGGVEGQGFAQLMQSLPQERHQIGVTAVAAMELAIDLTIEYVKDRKAFGKSVFDFQNTQFKLAEAKTTATVGKVFAEHCTELLIKGQLDTVTASMSKYWLTDMACKIIDDCVQLHGGYGFMNEYHIAKMYKDQRVARIYGGTNEIMKLVIARSL